MSDASRPPGAPGRIRRLAMKELRETLRDRRTIITLVLMPVLIYPLLSLVFQRLLLTSLKPPDETVYQIGVTSSEDEAAVRRQINRGSELLKATTTAPAEDDDTSEIEHYKFLGVKNLDEAVASMDVDLGIHRHPLPPVEFRGRMEPAEKFELIVLRKSRMSRDAASFVERRLAAVQSRALEDRLRSLGAGGETQTLSLATREVAPKDGSTAFSLAALVPLILILMTITGAVYPAIDLTAGERERGTLEALIAAPVPRLGLLLAKYVAVLTVALLTATVNLISMVTTIAVVGLGPVIFGPQGLTLQVAVEVFGLLILFAAFFSALLLAVTSFARSFKEAQAYLIPLMMLSITPGVVSLLPGVELTAPLAVTPLLNIVLLARDLCEQHRADPLLALVVVVSTSLFAAAALSVAARVFGADAILYGSRGSWSELLRKPAEPSETPTSASALFTLAMLFPAYFLMSHLLGRMVQAEIETRLLVSAGVTLLLFGGLPLAVCAMRRVRLPGGLAVRSARWTAFAGSLLLGCALWAVAFELVIALEQFGIAPLDPALKKRAEELIVAWKESPPWLIVLTLAVVPGVCEELFFRGFLLTALRNRLKPWPAIIVSAVLFGAFHIVMTDALTLVRFVPSTFLGIVLGWVCVRTGSVLPGMLLHSVHNGLLEMAAYYADDLRARGWGIEETSHLPFGWWAAAFAAGVAGWLLVYTSASSEPRVIAPSTAEST